MSERQRDPIRVIVVDDDAIVRSALVAYADASPDIEVLGAYENGDQAVEAVGKLPIDVVLMDIRMPVKDGISAAAEIKAMRTRAKVLLLTSFDEDDYAINALRLGASGFLLKDASPRALVDAVRAVHEGTTVVSPEPLSRLLRATAPPPSRSASSRPRQVDLSARELDILRLLCQAHSNAEIADALYLSESTVKTHVSAIMGKLMVNSRLKAVIRAYEWGLVERES